MTTLPPEDLDEAKRSLRAAAGKKRAALHAALKETAPAALAARGLDFTGKAAGTIVSGFYPYRSEIDTRPLLARLAGEGWTTALPVVIAEGQPLIFRMWAPGAATEPGMWDIPVPPAGAPEVYPDVLLCPMLAYDANGYRLGYGGGFYDRTLELLRAIKPVIAIGTAYAGQEVDRVPRGVFDAPLDFILTETGVIACG